MSLINAYKNLKKEKFFGIRIPKNGTTTLESAMPEIHHLPGIGRKCPRHKHRTYSDIMYKLGSCGIAASDCFTYSFVRNPFDRQVSQWRFSMRHTYVWKCKRNIDLNKLSFSEYVKQMVADGEYPYTNHLPTWSPIPGHQHKKFGGDVRSDQCYYLQSNPMDAEPIIDIDFIGRFETYQESFDELCSIIGLPGKKLSHRNKTKHKHYTEYYDDESRAIVAAIYAKDLEYFGYKFGE